MPYTTNESKIPPQKLGDESGGIPEIKVKTAFNGYVNFAIRDQNYSINIKLPIVPVTMMIHFVFQSNFHNLCGP